MRIYNGAEWDRVKSQSFAGVSGSDDITASPGPETFAQTYSIPANSLWVGSVICAKVLVRVTADAGAGNLVVSLLIGGSAISIAGISSGVVTGDRISLDVAATVRAIGMSGAIHAMSLVYSKDDIRVDYNENTSLDTTGALAVEVTAELSAASNSVRLETFIVGVT
jgi:hypothetical protein